MTILLTLKEKPDIPLEADNITPSQFAGKSLMEIGEIEIHQGNRSLPLEEFFEIEGDGTKEIDETEIILKGNLKQVKMIGRGMNGGRLSVEGDTGMYLGAEMIAGRIKVSGSVDAWAAAEQEGGNIQIEGNAGDYLCAGYRGSAEGMRGGRVYVGGDVGRELASQMRRGFIAVKGNVGEMAAVRMRGGSIMIGGGLGPRVGIGATRGMIFALGRVDSLPPTYKYSGISKREFTGYYLRYLKLRRPDFMPEGLEPTETEKWVKFVGDFAEGNPREEIYARVALNEHLVS
ncbi:formylmethanofuran dehydrogenase subunit C [Candidatus Thorarchaeota archaeon]|nr:MAG: formylmethanofuran dehydrogenase subunit C [Candidatus Thorarchaeota archaeon]